MIPGAQRTFRSRTRKEKSSTRHGEAFAASAGHRASYEWEYSTDGGKTWVTTPVTLQAKTTILGLTAGTTVQFRHRPVTKTVGALDAPDQLTPTYESWIVRRESWLPPFPLTRRYDRDRDPTGRSEE